MYILKTIFYDKFGQPCLRLYTLILFAYVDFLFSRVTTAGVENTL